MKKINYSKQELDLVDRLLGLLKAERFARLVEKQPGQVTEPATRQQLGVLARLGIYPKWQATRYEAEEMICHYRQILGTVFRTP
jgi:hypothetical protein